MPIRAVRALVIPILAVVCAAQQAELTENQQRARAERLARDLEFEQFHQATAKAFRKLGPVALDVLEKTLRDGTEIEARGALACAIAVPGADDRVIRVIDWVLTHRERILRDGNAPAALTAFLGRRAPNNPRAVDTLWSMLGGPFNQHVTAWIGSRPPHRKTLIGHLARDLDSDDEKRIQRAVRFLALSSRFGRSAPDVRNEIEKFFAGKKRDLTKIEELTRSKNKLNKMVAQHFLSLYRGVEKAQRAQARARESAMKRTATDRAERYVRLLKYPELRNHVITALSKLGDPAIPTLVSTLSDKNPTIADGAARALLVMKPQTLLSILEKLAADKSKTSAPRITALSYLAKTMDTHADRFEILRARTDASEPAEVRIAAIREMSGTTAHRHEVINVLESTLRDKNSNIAEYATTTLGVMCSEKDPRIMMLLLRQLQSKDKLVQKAAVFALAGKDANLHLERLKKKPELDKSVRSAIEIVLRQKKRVLAGFVIADYSDNRIIQLDLKGEEIASIEEIFGVWDVEVLDNGGYLITEFSVNRVTELDAKHKSAWRFGDLKNPYDSDRLLNGNTLIADTFGRRVIEVDKLGKIVWKYDKGIHPYDVDRLPNGNTLIADTKGDRVIEVTPTGEIVWSVNNVPNVHDADRLPNGNTLLTIRMLNEVREVDKDGRTVFQLKNLRSPSDADRLPDGRTIVAENGAVRMFDSRGKEVWKKRVTWAVEINPVWKHQRDAQIEAAKK